MNGRPDAIHQYQQWMRKYGIDLCLGIYLPQMYYPTQWPNSSGTVNYLSEGVSVQ